jgi:hypothetical protein
MPRIRESAPEGPYRAGRSLPQGPLSRKRGRRPKSIENGHSAGRRLLRPGWLRPDPVPPSLRRTPETLWLGRQGIYFGRGDAHRSILPTVLNKPRDGFTMQDDDGKGAKQDRRQDQRQDRLKLALRENLKRRKSQARGRDLATPSNPEDPAPYDVDAGKPGK